MFAISQSLQAYQTPWYNPVSPPLQSLIIIVDASVNQESLPDFSSLNPDFSSLNPDLEDNAMECPCMQQLLNGLYSSFCPEFPSSIPSERDFSSPIQSASLKPANLADKPTIPPQSNRFNQAALPDQASLKNQSAASDKLTSKASQVTPSGNALSASDQELAQRINQAIDETSAGQTGQALGPNGKPNPGLRGQGELIVKLARQYNLPVELLMAQLQKESSFLSDANNLSIANNNPGNLRYAEWESQDPFNGKADGPGNFTSFPSIEQGLTAYAALLRNVYGQYIDNKDWQGMVYKYAPPSENDSALYTQELIDWQANWKRKLNL